MNPSDDDDRLVRFLKDYEPCPPSPALDHEAALMAIIEARNGGRNPRHRSKKLIWLLPTAIAAGLTVMWGQYKPAVSPPEVADNLALPTALVLTGVTADQELEAFLEESWSNSLGEHLYTEENLSYGYSNFAVEAVSNTTVP